MIRARTRRSPAWLLVVPVLLLAVWLGMRGLNVDTLWYDEWLSVYYAGGVQYGPIAPGDIWARVAARSTWPPGFQTLLAAWGLLAGWSHAAARVLPLLAGVLAVAWMYRLARDLAGARVGLAAAAILGGSAFFAHYLHELRGYTLAVLFALVCVWGYIHTVRRSGFWPGAALFAGAVGLLYTHYFAALTLPAIALYHLAFVPKTRAWWRVPLLMAGAALLFVPWVGVALSTAQDTLESETRRIVPLSAGPILRTFVYSFANGSVALLALVLAFAWRPPAAPRPRRLWTLALLWLACALGVAVLANERLRVIFHLRHLLTAWPALALLCALGVARLARAGVPAVLVLSLWLASGVWAALDPAFMARQPGAESGLSWPDLSAVLRTVERRGGPQDTLVYHLETPGREWLTEGVVDFYSDALEMDYVQLEAVPGLPGDDYRTALRAALEDAPRVWVAAAPGVPSPYHLDELARVLAESYAACGRVADRPTLTLDLYARLPAGDQPPYRFGDAVGLRLLAPLPDAATGSLDALLGWSVASDTDVSALSYALHLLDAAGRLVAQTDAALPPDPFACAAPALDLRGVPAGDYALAAVVYNWQTGERLRATGPDGPAGDAIWLGEVRVRQG